MFPRWARWLRNPTVIACVLVAIFVASACDAASVRPTDVPLPFTSVSAGWFHTCGILQDGSAVCWGLNSHGQSVPPEDAFISISSGRTHTCGLKADNSVACWGDNEHGQSSPPEGRFKSVVVGLFHSCGVTFEGAAQCWGANGLGQSEPPEEVFQSIAAAWNNSCGITEDGALTCWSSVKFLRSARPEGRFREVSLGVQHGCVLTMEGMATCWGIWGTNPPMLSTTTFESINGGSPVCGLLQDRTVRCWGFEPSYGYRDEPPVATPVRGRREFPRIMAELENGTFVWRDFQGDFLEGAFRSVSVGLSHVCGVRGDGSVVCKGQNDYGQADAPLTP